MVLPSRCASTLVYPPHVVVGDLHYLRKQNTRGGVRVASSKVVKYGIRMVLEWCQNGVRVCLAWCWDGVRKGLYITVKVA
jgi:hypothetical protein